MSFFRSVLFLVTFYFFTILLSIISLPLLALPHRFASHLGSFWGLIVNLCLKIIPIDFSIKGNVCKREQVIYAVKHQSAWETLILYWQLERPIVVLKKELLLIPIIGAARSSAITVMVWPISIDFNARLAFKTGSGHFKPVKSKICSCI